MERERETRGVDRGKEKQWERRGETKGGQSREDIEP
jgi:hypothetical protein